MSIRSFRSSSPSLWAFRPHISCSNPIPTSGPNWGVWPNRPLPWPCLCPDAADAGLRRRDHVRRRPGLAPRLETWVEAVLVGIGTSVGIYVIFRLIPACAGLVR